MARILDDEHIQHELLEWIRKYGVYEFTGFTVTSKEVYSKTCFDGICSRATFYKYLGENPTFKEACDNAKKYFKQGLYAKDPGLRQEYIDKLTKLGTVGFVKVKKKKIVTKDAQGNILTVTETVEEDVSPPPFWAVRMLLGDGEGEK